MDNNYNYYEEEEEISLVDLIAYVFRHLKKMLIVSVILGLLLGGLLGYKKSGNGSINDEVKSYLVSKEALANKIDSANEDLNDYIGNNNFFSLTPSNSVQVRALYYVDGENTSSLINAYIAKLTSSDCLMEIADKYGIDERYVSDYVYVYSHNNKYLSVSDKASVDVVQTNREDNLIDINVYYGDEEIANNILNDLQGKVSSYHNELLNSIGSNKINLVSKNVYRGVNNNIVSVQQEKIEYINDFVTSLTSVQEQLNSLNTSGEIYNASFTKTFVKFGIVGFVCTFFVMCVYYALVFIFSDKVYSANEFKDKAKIRVVGNLTYKKSNDKYINWINKLEKRPVSNDYELIASNIKAYGNVNKVLLSGDLEDGIKEDIVSNLKKLLKNVEIISCGSLLTDSSAVNELDSVDSVILLAKCNESYYKTIKEEKDKLNDLKVTNVYAIVVE